MTYTNRITMKSIKQILLKKLLKILLLVVFLLLPLLVYITKFGSYEWSGSPEDWASFGDYVGGLYSGVLATILTVIIYLYNKKEKEERERKVVVNLIYPHLGEFFYKFDTGETPQIEDVNNFAKAVISNKIILPKSLFDELIGFSDYCKEVVNGESRDFSKEMKIENKLRKYCNGKNF